MLKVFLLISTISIINSRKVNFAFIELQYINGIQETKTNEHSKSYLLLSISEDGEIYFIQRFIPLMRPIYNFNVDGPSKILSSYIDIDLTFKLLFILPSRTIKLEFKFTKLFHDKSKQRISYKSKPKTKNLSIEESNELKKLLNDESYTFNTNFKGSYNYNTENSISVAFKLQKKDDGMQKSNVIIRDEGNDDQFLGNIKLRNSFS